MKRVVGCHAPKATNSEDFPMFFPDDFWDGFWVARGGILDPKGGAKKERKACGRDRRRARDSPTFFERAGGGSGTVLGGLWDPRDPRK